MVTCSVTCFKAIVGAEADSTVTNIFDNLGDDALDDIDMEPLDPSDLVSELIDTFLQYDHVVPKKVLNN